MQGIEIEGTSTPRRNLSTCDRFADGRQARLSNSRTERGISTLLGRLAALVLE
jgi:hypothetical protein